MSKGMIPERLVFIDLETTGLEPWRPVMQVAAIAVAQNLAELEHFEAKVQFPKKWADPAALRKVHYSPSTWRRYAKPAREVARELAAFLCRHATIDMRSADGSGYRVAQIVAHNAAFDGAFLRNWFDRLDLFFPGHFRMLCTVQRAIWLFQEDATLTPPDDYKLGTLCQYFGVRLRPEEAHDALNDVRATLKLYRAMVEHIPRRQVFRMPPVRSLRTDAALHLVTAPDQTSFSDPDASRVVPCGKHLESFHDS